MSYKRKLEEFDPTRSDSEDGDYDEKASRPVKRVRNNKASPRKPVKRRRDRYGDSSDIENDSLAAGSEDEDSFGANSSDNEPVRKHSTQTMHNLRCRR